MSYRKWEKDIEQCVKRLFSMENAVEQWMKNGGGNMEVFGFLNPEGNTAIDLPRHPYLDLNKTEQKVWTQCFGKPLQVPKDLLSRVSIKDFLDTVKERREMYRECIAFTNNSRFRNKNYKTEPKAANSSQTNPHGYSTKKKTNPKKGGRPNPNRRYKPKTNPNYKGKRPGNRNAPKRKPKASS